MQDGGRWTVEWVSERVVGQWGSMSAETGRMTAQQTEWTFSVPIGYLD